MKKIFLAAFTVFFLSSSFVFAAQTIVYFPNFEKNLKTKKLIKYYSAPGAAFQKTNNTLYFLALDHLGSTRAISANRNYYLSYYPFGKLKDGKTTPASITNLYTGQKKDSQTKLYYYHARYYNPQIAHFVSADYAQGPNRFSYVVNNPINKNDPTGQRVDEGLNEGLISKKDILSNKIEKAYPVKIIGNYSHSHLKQLNSLLAKINFSKIYNTSPENEFSFRYEKNFLWCNNFDCYRINLRDIETTRLIINFNPPPQNYKGMYIPRYGLTGDELNYIFNQQVKKQIDYYFNTGEQTNNFDITTISGTNIMIDPANPYWSSVFQHEFTHHLQAVTDDFQQATTEAITNLGADIVYTPPPGYECPFCRPPGVYNGWAPSQYGRINSKEWGAEVLGLWSQWHRYIHKVDPAYYATIVDYIPGFQSQNLGGVIE